LVKQLTETVENTPKHTKDDLEMNFSG